MLGEEGANLTPFFSLHPAFQCRVSEQKAVSHVASEHALKCETSHKALG